MKKQCEHCVNGRVNLENDNGERYTEQCANCGGKGHEWNSEDWSDHEQMIHDTFNKPIKETSEENIFIPSTLRGDRVRFWDNYNDDLVNRISNIKSN